MYLLRAHGAYKDQEPSGLKKGKRTTYFYGLEKRRQEMNTINTLVINNNECTNPDLITKTVDSFYKDMYSSSFSENECDALFKSTESHIPKITPDFWEECDSEIEMYELDIAIKQLSPGKSACQDGLTSNVYKFFWEEIK